MDLLWVICCCIGLLDGSQGEGDLHGFQLLSTRLTVVKGKGREARRGVAQMQCHEEWYNT